MNIDQVYDELYGVIDRNKAADVATQGKVAALEETVSTQGTTIASHTGQIAALQEAIPEVPGRQLKLINLGTEYTDELKADIYTGTFEKAVVGGFLTINDHVYIIADHDYYLNTGTTGHFTTDHHVVMIPAGIYKTASMNQTDITTGGYNDSVMRNGYTDTTDPDAPVHVDGGLEEYLAMVQADFGADNILNYYSMLTSAVTDGVASNAAWVECGVEIPSEEMLFGNTIRSTSVFEVEVEKTQLKLFSERPDLIAISESYWLRTVCSATEFGGMQSSGNVSKRTASRTSGIRPYFLLKGAPPETRTKKRKG